jgi:SAM-dependent methyltransferase
MNDHRPFTDPDSISAMEAEHLPLWRAFIRSFAHLLVPGARVMDFGCNRGGLLVLLCREGVGGAAPAPLSLAVGIDVDTSAMRRIVADAAAASRGHPIVFTTGSPGRFSGQFDLVVSHEVVYLLSDLPGAFSEIHASLARGGHFCFATGCHLENPLFAQWREALAAEGIAAFERTIDDYEAALHAAGFHRVARDRLLLTRDEYGAWTAARASRAPNPAWFPSSAVEEHYYTEIGKAVLTAQRR